MRLSVAMALGRTMLAGAIFATAATMTGCGVEVGPAYPDGYYGDYPPDAYLATTEPVYYDGRPSYWYGGHWYYRDGAAWRHYDREPPALYQRRMAGPPVRRTYDRAWGHPAARPAPPRGRR